MSLRPTYGVTSGLSVVGVDLHALYAPARFPEPLPCFLILTIVASFPKKQSDNLLGLSCFPHQERWGQGSSHGSWRSRTASKRVLEDVVRPACWMILKWVTYLSTPHSFRWCEYCGYHTIQKSNLEQHARTSHASLLCSSQAPGANVFMTDVSASPTSDSPFCGPAYTISTPSPVGQAYSPIPALIPTAQDAQHVGDYRIHSESMSSSFEFSPQLADPEILGRLCGTTSSLQPPYEHCQAHIRPTEYSEDNADWCRF